MSFFKKRLDSENRTKPIWKCETMDERRQWFATTRPWNAVPAHVPEAVMLSLREKILLEVWVLVSEESGLISRYVALGRDPDFRSPEMVKARVSELLTDTGATALKAVADELRRPKPNPDKISPAYQTVINAYEVALVLSQDQLGAYFGMAILNEREECQEWARKGLARVEALRATGIAFERSTVLPPMQGIEDAFRGFLAL